jgi:hypothetical protein
VLEEGNMSLYLPHAARFLFHTTFQPMDNEQKTIYHVQRVDFARVHDAFSKTWPILWMPNSETHSPVVIFHYRHLFNRRALRMAYEDEAEFWKHFTREAHVADVLQHVPLPTVVSDMTEVFHLHR